MALSIDGALRFLEENADRPVFLFLHTYDVHGPYRDRSVTDGASSADSGAPHVTVERLPLDESASFIPQYRPRWQSSDGILGEPLTEAELRSLPALYDDGIASVDRQLGRLFDYLRVSGLERDTIVVLTSDHGEMLGEGGSFGHNYLFDENLQVPLIVAYPGAVPGARVPSQVRSIDILPTILDLAGVDPLTGIDGTSLTALMNGGTDVPRDAWSYGPATNAGVSLRTATGTEIHLQQHGLPSVCGTRAGQRFGRIPSSVARVGRGIGRDRGPAETYARTSQSGAGYESSTRSCVGFVVGRDPEPVTRAEHHQDCG